MKCKKGYKLQDGKCRKKEGLFKNLTTKIKNKRIWWIAGIIAVVLIIFVLIIFNFDGIKNLFSIGNISPAPTGSGGGGGGI